MPKNEFECPHCGIVFCMTTAGKNLHIRKCEIKQQHLNKKYICKKCNKEYLRKDGISDFFCSRKCSNSRTMSEETKLRIKKGVMAWVETNGLVNHKTRPKKFCKHCANEIGFNNRSGYCKSCVKMVPERFEQRQKSGKKVAKKDI